jgi:galactosamine-6-phosphate isomerase
MPSPPPASSACSDLPFLVRRARDHEAMSQAAARALIEQLRRKPDTLLVLATGATPERTYRLLAERGLQEPDLGRQVRIAKLDEWGGLDPDDPASCEDYLRRVLCDPLGIVPERRFGWRCRPTDPTAECCRVRELMTQLGPADVCVLGLGVNGHLGFNEPGPTASPWPHQAVLSKASLDHSMVKVARRRPEYGLTLGLRDILGARQVWLLVSGTHKREPLRRLLQPAIATDAPASFLWLHPALTIFCDEAAWPGSA